MKIPRILAVFFCAAGAVLALAIIKALVVSGLDTLPPVKVLVFAASTFGLIAALLDWALLRDRRTIVPVADIASEVPVSGEGGSQFVAAEVSEISKARSEAPDNAIGLRPIIFREISAFRHSWAFVLWWRAGWAG